GQYDEADLNRAFDRRHVLYGLRRLGVMDSQECTDVCHRLPNHEFSFAKVLVANSATGRGGFRNLTLYCQIELDDAVEFIRTPMNRYRGDKEASRMFFPDDLIQFFAREAGLPIANTQNVDEE